MCDRRTSLYSYTSQEPSNYESNLTLPHDSLGNIDNSSSDSMEEHNIFDDIIDTDDENELSDDCNNEIWIFGYGSLCWNPGFDYQKSLTGYVKGFSRKFWQGSVTHRGTREKPGRVATLIEDNEAIVWGKVFKIPKENNALDYLHHRECSSGGYVPITVSVHIKDHHNHGLTSNSITAITYIATCENYLWLGEASLMDICLNIVSCKGHAGYNVEYLLKLAEYMRAHIPEENDAELFTLEELCREHINAHNLWHLIHDFKKQEGVRQDQSRGASTTSSEFASRLPEKKLRCLHI